MGIKHKAVKAHGDKGLASEWNDEHEIDGNVPFDGYEALKLCIHTSVDPPAAPNKGQLYYDTDDDQIYIWNTVAWVPLVQNPYVEDVDCNQKESQNHVIENRTDFPGGPVTGQIIYRTDTKTLYIYDGTDWVQVGDGAMPDYYPTDAEYAAKNRTQVTYGKKYDGGGFNTIYTVPVGKVFYLTSASLSTNNIACADKKFSAIERWDGATAYEILMITLDNNDRENCIANSFPSPIKMNAGDIIRFDHNGCNQFSVATIQGWLEDV